MDVITFPVNLQTTSGLSILLHGVILLPDATPYDKSNYIIYKNINNSRKGPPASGPNQTSESLKSYHYILYLPSLIYIFI